MPKALKEHRIEALLVVVATAIFLFLIFIEDDPLQKSNMLTLFITLALATFVAATLFSLLILGFQSFAFFIFLFLLLVVWLEGILGATIVIVLTYLVWGFVFAIQTLLADNDVHSAIEWFQKRYDYKGFMVEYRFFYPMIALFYFFFEWLPAIIVKEPIITFSPSRIKAKMKSMLKG